MMPNSDRSGVSRKIDNADKRHELREILNQLSGKSKTGVIIRTAGIERPPADLKRDFAALQREWKEVEQAFKKQAGPGLLYRQPKSTERVLRDYFTENVKEVWVDSAEAFQEALRYIKAMLPRYQKRLKLYVGDKSLFSTHNVEAQIEALDARKMPLPSGGSIIIESTEALVSIDVNSGKSNQASDIEATALRTNLEAADEAGRQLRLRNLGGLIVIDFIDMNLQKNRSRVEKAMAEALSQDKARTTIGSISQFGLLELSRQRIDMELTRGLRMECSGCGGTGFVPTVNTGANNVLRKIRELAASGEYSEIRGELPLEYANFLLNKRRESLRDLELEFGLVLHLVGNPALPAGQPIQLNGVPMGEAPAKLVTGEEERIDSESGGEEARSHRRRRRRRPPHREGESEFLREPAEEPDNGQTPWPETAAAAPEEEFDEVSEEFDEVGEEAVEAEGEGEEDLQPSAPDEISEPEPVPVEEVRVNTPPTLKGWKFPQIRFKTARRGSLAERPRRGGRGGRNGFSKPAQGGGFGLSAASNQAGGRAARSLGPGRRKGKFCSPAPTWAKAPRRRRFRPARREALRWGMISEATATTPWKPRMTRSTEPPPTHWSRSNRERRRRPERKATPSRHSPAVISPTGARAEARQRERYGAGTPEGLGSEDRDEGKQRRADGPYEPENGHVAEVAQEHQPQQDPHPVFRIVNPVVIAPLSAQNIGQHVVAVQRTQRDQVENHQQQVDLRQKNKEKPGALPLHEFPPQSHCQSEEINRSERHHQVHAWSGGGNHQLRPARIELPRVGRHRLGPAEPGENHHHQAHGVNMGDRVERKPAHPLRGVVTEPLGREGVAILVEREGDDEGN